MHSKFAGKKLFLWGFIAVQAVISRYSVSGMNSNELILAFIHDCLWFCLSSRPFLVMVYFRWDA